MGLCGSAADTAVRRLRSPQRCGATMAAVSARFSRRREVGGIGQDVADVAQEERGRLPVDQTVIEGEAQRHEVAQRELALVLPGPPLQ